MLIGHRPRYRQSPYQQHLQKLGIHTREELFAMIPGRARWGAKTLFSK